MLQDSISNTGTHVVSGLYRAQTWSVSSTAGLYKLYRYPRCIWVFTGLKPGLYPVLQDSISYIGTHEVFDCAKVRSGLIYSVKPLLQDCTMYSIYPYSTDFQVKPRNIVLCTGDPYYVLYTVLLIS